jgi:hypothetical protein
LRLATKPSCTGLPAVVKTIGMVWVAAIAALVAGSLSMETMTATLRLTRSAAIAGNRSN